MARLTWDERRPGYANGVSHGVLYSGGQVAPWNGLLTVDEKASGSIETVYFVDGEARQVAESIGDFQASIEAFMYPEMFERHTGYTEEPTYERFGLSYRTLHSTGYRLNIVYNALAQPTDKSRTTRNSVATPSTFTWDIQSTDRPIPGARPAAHLVIDSVGYLGVIGLIENILYGTDTSDPRLPEPDEVVEIFESATTMRIRHNGDGTWSATGPDDMVRQLNDGTFEIDSPTAYYYDINRYVIDSY